MRSHSAKHTVQWGRSVPAGQGQITNEFVRIELPDPRDFTLYLNDPSLEFGLPNLNEFEISVGNGGTSWVKHVLASQRGTVMHFVASQLVVRATVTFGVTAIVPATSARVMAAAGFGRPTTIVTVRTIDGSSIAAGATAEIRLSPFATHVQVLATRDLDTDPINATDNVLVREQIVVDQASGVPIVVGENTDTPISQWVQPHPLQAFSNNLVITNNNAALGPALRFAIAETITH